MNPAAQALGRLGGRAKSVRVGLITVGIGAVLGMTEFVANKLTRHPIEPRHGTINDIPVQTGVWYAVTIHLPNQGTPTTNVKDIR